MKQFFFLAALSPGFFFSCTKPQPIEVADQPIFYGRWKANYGDTVQFIKVNGKDFLIDKKRCDSATVEFSISNNKLSLKDDVSRPLVYRTIESFNWLLFNRKFEAKAKDWSICISNDLKFEFTRVD